MDAARAIAPAAQLPPRGPGADPRLGATLDDLQRRPKFKGVRHQVHDQPDARWLLRPDVLGGFTELARRDIPYDLLLYPAHLPLVPELAGRVPGLRMVIDHIAKPPIKRGEMDGWAQDMERAAAVPGLHVKLSGMITEADWAHWKAADLKPYADHVARLFGPWKEVLAAFTQALGPQPVAVRSKLLGESTARFYRLE